MSSNERRIGIVFALEEEKAGLQRVLEGCRAHRVSDGGLVKYTWPRAEAILTVGGVGSSNATAATRRLCEVGAEVVISSGFAAALDPALLTGDVVTAGHVVSLSTPSDLIACNRDIYGLLPPTSAFGFALRSGALLAGDRVIFSVEEKRQLHELTGAAAYDMESFAVGRVCEEAGVAFAAIRCVTDSAHHRVPKIVADLVSSQSTLKSCAMVAVRPRDWLPLLVLRKHAHIATSHLGEVLATALMRLT